VIVSTDSRMHLELLCAADFSVGYRQLVAWTGSRHLLDVSVCLQHTREVRLERQPL
jgi:hypothetical protein